MMKASNHISWYQIFRLRSGNKPSFLAGFTDEVSTQDVDEAIRVACGEKAIVFQQDYRQAMIWTQEIMKKAAAQVGITNLEEYMKGLP